MTASEGPCSRAPVFTVAVLVFSNLFSFCQKPDSNLLSGKSWGQYLVVRLSLFRGVAFGRYQVIMTLNQSSCFELCLRHILTEPGVSQPAGALTGG